MDRIEYEEWALKAVHEGRGVKIAKEGEKQDMIEVRCVFQHSTLRLSPTNMTSNMPSRRLRSS